MTKDGHAVALLSGDLSVDQRAAVISRFRRGIEKVLITTNVSARGMFFVMLWSLMLISFVANCCCGSVYLVSVWGQNLNRCCYYQSYLFRLLRVATHSGKSLNLAVAVSRYWMSWAVTPVLEICGKNTKFAIDSFFLLTTK